MKFKTIAIILILVIIGLFGYSIFLTTELNEQRKREAENYQTLLNLTAQDSLQRKKLDELAKSKVTDMWKAAEALNTLRAYSNYAQQHPDDTLHVEDLRNAVDKLLKNKGYVQYQETNGNKLYKEVNDLSLEGDYVVFKTDKSVRNGAIGIDDCGVSPPSKIDVVRQGTVVRVKELCHAPGSESIWAHIEYAKK